MTHRFYNLSPGKLFLRKHNNSVETQNPELLQYTNLKMHNFQQKYCKTSKKLRGKKKNPQKCDLYSGGKSSQ